jgi:hypothetical protein
MEQSVGIIKGSPGWITILKQEGLSYKIFEAGDNPPLLIVDGIISPSEILEYLRGGGYVITDTKSMGILLDEPTKRVKINYIVPDSSSFFRNCDIIDINSTGYIFDKKGSGKINNRLPAIFEFSYENGYCIALPFDVSSVILDVSSRMKFFYTDRGKFPAESVSFVSKGEVRKLVVNAMRYLFKRQGLHYIHKWYYPGRSRSAFLFRVDTDKSGLKEIYEIYKMAEKYGFPFTFFIDTESLGSEIKELKRFKDQEIGIHCYKHKVHDDMSKNRDNFMKAKKLLLDAGIETNGISVPYGMWNKNLGAIIEELSFQYSSEFSFSYDDLPSYPFGKKRFMDTLEIPIHPVSAGSLLYVRNSIDNIKYYFGKVIEEKYRKCEPLFLYGHSQVISEYPSIFHLIFKGIREKDDVWFGTYIGFYRWWKERENAKPEITIEKDTLKIEKSNRNDRLFFRIISPEGKETFISGNKEIKIDKLHFTALQPGESFHKDRLKVKSGNIKLKLKRIENWIKR